MPTLYNSNNVVVGVATLYVQPYVSGSPASLPPDSQAFGTQWSSPWVLAGGTDQGVKFGKNPKTVDIYIEEQSTPVDVLTDQTQITVDASLAEDTVQTMVWGFGGGQLSTVAPGASQVGKTTLTLQDPLVQWALGLETINSYGFWRRYLVPQAVQGAQTEVTFRRAAAKRMYPVTFTSICPPSQIQIVEMTANHT